MRNYIEVWTQIVVFTEDFTGSPIAVISVGDDEDDVSELMGFALQDAYAQFPGSTFGATFTEGPTPMFFEMDKHIVSRAVSPILGSVLAQPMLNAGNFLGVFYNPGARTELDLSPEFFAKFLKEKSPRAVWSHGH